MDVFYSLGEVTITIAGFAALFSILRPQKKTWNEFDIYNLIRFYMMIEFACLISIFSFLPVLLLGYVNPEIAFRLSFCIYFLVVFPYIIFGMKRAKRLSGKIAINGTRTVILLIIWNKSLKPTANAMSRRLCRNGKVRATLRRLSSTVNHVRPHIINQVHDRLAVQIAV
jgi:hypothetical protein